MPLIVLSKYSVCLMLSNFFILKPPFSRKMKQIIAPALHLLFSIACLHYVSTDARNPSTFYIGGVLSNNESLAHFKNIISVSKTFIIVNNNLISCIILMQLWIFVLLSSNICYIWHCCILIIFLGAEFWQYFCQPWSNVLWCCHSHRCQPHSHCPKCVQRFDRE